MSDIRDHGPSVQLPDGQTIELSWQERALCAQTDPEAFFPEKGGSTREQSGYACPVMFAPNALNMPWRMTSASVSGAVSQSVSVVASSVVRPNTHFISSLVQFAQVECAGASMISVMV